MEEARISFQKSFLLLFIFYSAFFAVYILLGIPGYVTLPDESAFLNWDAMHYQTIRDHGYKTGMVAFFPLFSMLWKITFVGNMGISILNGLIFICSLSWLATLFNIGSRRLLLLASIPSLIFMFLPFSEAVFFLSCSILLAGLKKNQPALMIAGIILAGITRPVATVFIPALIILHFLSAKDSKNKLLLTGSMIVSTIAILLLVFYVQYLQTGEWFSFFIVQKNWGNYLRLPVFPLNSWAGGFIVRLDAIAFLSGVSAGIFILYLLFKRIKYKQTDNRNALIFSACYLSLIALIVLFTRGGMLNSLNRYLFCTAFFIVAMNGFLESNNFSSKNVLLVFLLSGIFWLMFASYVHIQTLLKFMFLTLYLVMLFCSTAENRFLKNAGSYGVVGCNIIFMFILFHRFFTGGWVG